MKSITQLIPDIQVLLTRKDGWFTNELSQVFGNEVARRLQEKFNAPERTPQLRLSKMGPRCPRALWYSIHHPEMAEEMPPWAEMKFSFGHIIEALAITLAKAAGHTVTGEQDAISVDGILGHRDCIINGCLLDVKSCSSIAFSKYRSGSLSQSDDFGYLDQLDGYLLGSIDDPLLLVKDRGYLLMIDKVLGHMYLYEHILRADSIKQRIASYKQIVSCTEPPPCNCRTIPEGESGNYKLDTKASYNSFKHLCFPKLRTFIYAKGPVYLSQVARRPAAHIAEIDRHGNFIYN